MRPPTVGAYVSSGAVASATDVLATNRMARLLLADFDAMPVRVRNATRWPVLDEGARSLWGDKWEKGASSMAGALRMDAAKFPDDPRTAELVGEAQTLFVYLARPGSPTADALAMLASLRPGSPLLGAPAVVRP
ncbi:hypothetical protein [Actinoplanes couchii]|uniref:MmyB-like transcription regulator ligand binding domain-containing protein n=1 Tax=Actinoplanes couchii TaxID=403638 RepID=A0ABQ3XL29_9ACTN|nr:hypothetical protein [Actinoplanes couchii]MDR6318419.1 hypothetical protein [Actinoplanes couchii]GID59215.1 hypothetical protein Aco03nite_076190 [Actinoplanes couchii]